MVVVGICQISQRKWNEYLWPSPDVRRRIGGTTAMGLTFAFLQQAEIVTNWGPVMAVTLLRCADLAGLKCTAAGDQGSLGRGQRVGMDPRP